MNIGQLARRAGVPIDTVRYYERQQLLPTAARSAGGYRIFGEQDLRRLRFIAAPRRWASAWKKSPNCWRSVTATHRTWQCARHGAGPTAGHCTTHGRTAAHAHRAFSAGRRLPRHGTLDQCPILAALTDDAA